jgi:polyphosphate glucokinase
VAVVFGIDVGGSGVKGAPVDVEQGILTADRFRIKTPRPATPGAIRDVIVDLLAHFGWRGPVGCALPAVVEHGIVRTAANIDPSWIDTDAHALVTDATGCPAVVLNDADAAGIAEMRFGAGRGSEGVALMLTFGTGVGSALFAGGRLVPNTEFGHVEFHGGPAEHYAAARLVEHEGMDLERWAGRVAEYLAYLERILSPDLIVMGGGISKRFAAFSGSLRTRAELRPATLRNNAGIVGAALAAHGAIGDH